MKAKGVRLHGANDLRLEQYLYVYLQMCDSGNRS